MPGHEVLEITLRELCAETDPSRPYIPESPYGGYDHNDPRVWDTHSYSFFAYVPGMRYPNFVSEELRISPPMLKSCRRFMCEEDIWPAGYTQVHKNGDLCEVPPTWLKYTAGGESNLKFGPMWLYYDATDAESMVHRAAYAAADYTRSIIERVRMGRPSGDGSGVRNCGGYLTWKYNDAWPQIYGAKVDWFLEPNIGYYTMKRAFQPVSVIFNVDDRIHIWVINDSPENISGRLDVKLFHITENCVKKQAAFYVSVKAGESVDVSELTDQFQTFRNQNILFAALTGTDGRLLARTTQLVAPERVITFPKAAISLRVLPGSDSFEVTTDRYAHCVYLSGNENGDSFGWYFSENYFSLLPGEIQTVNVKTDHRQGEVTARDFYSGIATCAVFTVSR
jgi:hypothetical protein